MLIIPIFAACSGGGAAAPAASSSTTSGSTTTTSNLTMSAMTFGANPLAAFGTTSVSVNVLSNGALTTTPVTVNFSSPCATATKANLTASTTTVNGVATVSYVDNACAGSDVITASVTSGPTASGTLTVTAPSSGSITSVTASPATINLRGTGGTETSRVTFKVFDTGGNAISGKTVNFSLNTTIGGITLSTPSSITDASGEVYVDVHAGTVGTPVRVTASTLTNAGITLSTQSSQLVISTGLPDQDSFSLSNQTYNIEGWDYDGVSTTLTVRLADHFNNPVPDGTAVYFTTEGGAITPSCSTVGGVCTATLTSQAPRPIDGRVTVLAYAIGEESFNDLDGDGLADLAPNETVLDMPEAWRDDDNSGGARDVTEIFIDFNNSGTYNAADGKFNTSLCNESVDADFPGRISSPGSCSSQKTLHVRQSLEVVFSGSFVDTYAPGTLTLNSCADTYVQSEVLSLVDLNGNPLPFETQITLSFPTGSPVTTTGSSSFKILNSTKTGLSTTLFPFYITTGGTCASGDMTIMTVKATTPKGNTTEIVIPVDVL